MHSLLSVTALHIASTNPDNQSLYIDAAIRHHNIALKEYSSNLDSITPKNSPAIFACASLIVIFVFNLAILQQHKELRRPVEEMLSIFMLLRGVPVILKEMRPWVEESKIAPMFKGRDIDPTIVLPDSITRVIQQLEERNNLLSQSACDRETYAHAIQILEETFKRIASKDSDNGMVLSWPVGLEPAYITLLGERQPMALVILAYYAVILNEIEDSWWVRGWGRHLILDISQMVDEDWRTLIAWPMEKIGAGGKSDLF